MGAIGLAGLALVIHSPGEVLGCVLFKRRRAARKQFEDPLTQPVVVPSELPAVSAKNGKKSKTAPRRTIWFRPRPAIRLPDAPAYLIRLTNGGEPASAAPIPVIDKEMTFGTDPVSPCAVLDDPPFLRCMPASSEMARALSISTITARWRAPGSTMNQSHAKADGWHMETGSILDS